MSKREVANNQEPQSGEAAADSHATPQKIDAPASGKQERKSDVKAVQRGEDRSNAKGDSKQETAASNASHGGNGASSNYGGRGSGNNKMSFARMDSYASVAKGATNMQEGQNYRGYYRNDQHRRRADYDAEDEDIVKAMMKLHRNRFREFRKLNDNQYREREAPNSQVAEEERAPRTEETQNSQEPLSTYSSTDSVAVQPTQQNRRQGAGESDEQPAGNSAELKNSRSSDGMSADAAEQNEAAGDETNAFAARPRRHDGVRNNYVDRRRKNFNDRFPADGEERAFGTYNRYKNKYNNHNNAKRDFKKEEKPQEA
ncbi:hypothetical protein, conserved [Babesia bigemina]|uniref:Btz domain-containing protein n=1 Tax=Babesia bigemina TaxID=5866 RepID=A0A061D1Q2_BABBI|nr:hypothetical protein, conserved [Babesia bigemina]CDR94578.1 hypothetical protein, conserved [Babesia bigemina]|eukprot:XP_012766764.1 hypothetical protein, conserved [Babesia bigemina]